MKNVYRVFILCCLLLLIGCQEESAAEVADTTAVVTEVGDGYGRSLHQDC